MKRIVICLFLWSIALHSEGQSFTTINYSVPEGLPSSEVYEVFQDRKGFLWFATDNGVVKFDGNEMEVFQVKEGLTDPVVFGFYEDGKGRLWFRTFSGKLCYYEDGKIKKYAYNDQLVSVFPNGLINFAYDTATHTLWFSIRNFLGKIDSTGMLTKETIQEPGIFYRTIKNTYLVGAANTRYVIKSITMDEKIFPVTPTDSLKVGSLCVLQSNNKVYISNYSDVYESDGKYLKKVISGSSTIISLSKDKEGNFWIGYLNHGAVRYDDDFKKSWAPEFLAKKSVTKVLQDNEGGLWFTTLENGVFHAPNLLIENHPLKIEAKIRTVLSADNEILIGDQAGILHSIDRASRKLLTKTKFNHPILNSFIDFRKNVWISTGKNAYLFDSNFNKKKVIEKIAAIDFSGDTMGFTWLYGSHMLKKIDAKGSILISVRLEEVYRSIHVDDSLIFLASRVGLHIRNKNLDLLKSPDVFSNFKIYDLIKVNDTTILITTLGSGFSLLHTKTLNHTQFNTEHDFIANNIYSVLKKDSMLWLGTEKGIAITNLNNLLKKDISFKYLTKKTGLASDKINFLISDSKAVWAFTDESFSIIPNSQTRFSARSPRFHLKSVTLNSQKIILIGEQEFHHDENNLHVTFGYISFSNQNIFTRYRLDPESPWNFTTNKNLQFNSLSPGFYILELQYSTDNIHWEPAYIFPRIIIEPPLWQTWYFQTVIALLVLLLIVLYFTSQVGIYKRHQRKLIQAELEAIEEERSRIAKDLHDSVGTDFTAIKMIVSQLLTKHSEPKTGEVETQFQSTIQDIKNIIYGLSPPGLERYGLFSGLKNYVDKLNGTIPIKIEINTFGVEIKDPKLSMTVFRILQELISNSLKHSKAEKIAVHINSFEDLLNIVYEDNGKGFSFEENHKGLGLYNIESRIQSVNGKLKFDSGTFGISYTIDIPLTEIRNT